MPRSKGQNNGTWVMGVDRDLRVVLSETFSPQRAADAHSLTHSGLGEKLSEITQRHGEDRNIINNPDNKSNSYF